MPARVGIVGTGFIAMGLGLLLRTSSDMTVSRILTRRPINTVQEVDSNLLTRSMEDLMANSDIIVECSGDIIHACEVVKSAHEAGLPVVTMGAEFHVTVGSYFCNSGVLTEAEGDQP
ncbi:MAG: NAD(P)-dependent oxidoreductase, partial [Verrucomicrobium sp.]